MKRLIALLLLLATLPLCGAETPKRLRALYGSLDPTSISQHLALYQLYPSSAEGRAALARAWKLLNMQPSSPNSMKSLPLPTGGIEAIVAMVNKHPFDTPLQLTEEELALVDKLAGSLPNRRLKGFRVASDADVLALPPHEIDLARGLFLSQLGNTPEAIRTIRNYEAMLDLMALQILAKIGPNAKPEDKIRELNRFVFEEMNFRFPPHSVYAKDIDLYTFLPSVLDTRKGVCLGVSVLYLCLAQRVNLNLEIVTPPGHIYVRYRSNGKEINIETTMRGVHIDSEDYLGVDTRKLQLRDLKETVGLAHINQASVYLQTGAYAKAVACYEKAYAYLPHDELLTELLGYSLILSGDEARGRQQLEKLRDYLPDESVSKNIMVTDYLEGRMDVEGLEALFRKVDETLESLIAKRRSLEDAVKKHPDFRSGWFQLASTLLQMHRYREALICLDYYHELDPENVTAEYFLAAVHAARLDFNNAWDALHRTEALLAAREHAPKAIKMFRRQLALHAPE